MLCNILPYFGYLHQWKKTLESICKRTSQIWEENKREFVHCGRNLKKRLKYEYYEWFSMSQQNNIELYALYSCLYQMDHQTKEVELCNDDQIITNSWIRLLQKLDEDFAILFINDIADISTTNIKLWREKEVPEFLPSDLWTSSSADIKKFSLSEKPDWVEYIKKELIYKAVIVRKIEENIIEVKPVVNKAVVVYVRKDCTFSDYTDNFLKTYESCQNASCVWKPTELNIESKK